MFDFDIVADFNLLQKDVGSILFEMYDSGFNSEKIKSGGFKKIQLDAADWYVLNMPPAVKSFLQNWKTMKCHTGSGGTIKMGLKGNSMYVGVAPGNGLFMHDVHDPMKGTNIFRISNHRRGGGKSDDTYVMQIANYPQTWCWLWHNLDVIPRDMDSYFNINTFFSDDDRTMIDLLYEKYESERGIMREIKVFFDFVKETWRKKAGEFLDVCEIPVFNKSRWTMDEFVNGEKYVDKDGNIIVLHPSVKIDTGDEIAINDKRMSASEFAIAIRKGDIKPLSLQTTEREMSRTLRYKNNSWIRENMPYLFASDRYWYNEMKK